DDESKQCANPTSVQCRCNSRGDWMPLELFLAGIRGWEAGLRRWIDDGKPPSDWDLSTLMTQSGPDAPAQTVGRVERLSGNVRQPNHALANEIAGHKAERRPRAGEEWLAATKHDGTEVESILINKTKVGQASCQAWSGNVNLPNSLSLQLTYLRLDVIPDKCGVGPDRLQRSRHNPLLLAPPCGGEVAVLRVPVR